MPFAISTAEIFINIFFRCDKHFNACTLKNHAGIELYEEPNQWLLLYDIEPAIEKVCQR